MNDKYEYAKIIDESEIDTKTVQVGNIVKIHDEEFDEDLEDSLSDEELDKKLKELDL